MKITVMCVARATCVWQEGPLTVGGLLPMQRSCDAL